MAERELSYNEFVSGYAIIKQAYADILPIAETALVMEQNGFPRNVDSQKNITQATILLWVIQQFEKNNQSLPSSPVSPSDGN